MIDELELKLLDYAGRASHARCFLHTTNLIAKSLISMFDVKKKKGSSSTEENNDDIAKEIEELSQDLDEDERSMVPETEGSNTKEGTDDTDGLIDLVTEMAAHEARIRPVTLVLVKVCYNNRYAHLPSIVSNHPSQLRKLAFKIINSTTILLPACYDVLANLKLQRRNMPRGGTPLMTCFGLR